MGEEVKAKNEKRRRARIRVRNGGSEGGSVVEISLGGLLQESSF